MNKKQIFKMAHERTSKLKRNYGENFDYKATFSLTLKMLLAMVTKMNKIRKTVCNVSDVIEKSEILDTGYTNYIQSLIRINYNGEKVLLTITVNSKLKTLYEFVKDGYRYSSYSWADTLRNLKIYI